MSTAAVLVAVASHASPRIALVAAGRCDDPDLLEQSKDLIRAMQAQGGQLLDRDELIERLSASTSRLPAELERQIERAERQYFEADYSGAERRVVEAIAEVERLGPGSRRWQLFVRASLLHALVLRATSRPSDADERFRRVLRLDPDHRLDSDYFSPSTRARFDRVRRLAASEPRTALVVTSTPPGADIFVDGLALKGKTPLSLELPPGRYAVSLSKDGGWSFPRNLELPSSSSLHVDLEFESSFHSEVMPCFADADDEQLRLTSAVKLGSWLGIDQLVIARSERRSAGSTWLSAALIQVATGQKIREAGLKLDPSESSIAALGELADHISTGRPGRNIVASDVARDGAEGVTLTSSELPSMAGTAVPEQPWAALRPSVGLSKTVGQAFGAGLVGLGTLAVGAGMVFQLRADHASAALSRRYAGGSAPAVSELAALQSMRGRAAAQRSSAIVSYLIGAAAISAGAILVLHRDSRPDPRTSVSLTALPGGVLLDARWQ